MEEQKRGRKVGVGVVTGGRYRLPPSYRRLILDLGRPAAAPEATEALRQKVPDKVRKWLDCLLSRGELSVLRAIARPGRSEADIEQDMLDAALAWERDGGCGDGGDDDGDGDDDGAPAMALRPGLR